MAETASISEKKKCEFLVPPPLTAYTGLHSAELLPNHRACRHVAINRKQGLDTM
jgi:hypothetical protein